MGQPHHGRGEPELYKDKVEVSLDGRQIFYLFFGGAVLVGLVFVLGVMVGRRVESRSHVDGLSRMDSSRGASDPLAALDGLENRRLTFQDALTKGEPKTVVEQQIDELAKPKAEEPAAAKQDDKDDKDDKNDKHDKNDKKKADRDAAVTKPEQLSALPKPEKRPAQSDKADKPKPENKAARIEEPPVNADVVTAVDKPVPKPADKPSEPKGKFTLQLSSFQDKQEAETFLSSVKASGYQAYLLEAEVSGKGTWYRVRMGKYGSLEAANDAKADVEQSIKKSASVMRL